MMVVNTQNEQKIPYRTRFDLRVEVVSGKTVMNNKELNAVRKRIKRQIKEP